MVHRGLLILLAFAVFNKDCLVRSAPCYGLSSLLESLFMDDDDDSSEKKTTTTTTTAKPAPQTITVLLTPTADLATLSQMVQNANGDIYLLPSLLPLQQGGPTTEAPTTTTTTTEATTTTTTTTTTPAPTTKAPAAEEPTEAPAG